MKFILITGCAGNIGSSLTRKLINLKINVIGVDNLSTGSFHKLDKLDSNYFKFIKADVNDLSEIMQIFLKYDIEFVFHFAAVVGVQRTLLNPVNVLKDIDGLKNIFNLSKNTGVKRVFYSSSSEVYGEPVFIPQNEETTPLNSKLPYAIVKNIGEAFCKSYNKEYGLNYTIFRFFNTYGPNQSQDFVVPRFIKSAIMNEDLIIYGNGLQTRTFCYIDDNIDTMYKIMVEDKYINDTVNIGSDHEITILDLATQVINLLKSKSNIVHIDPLAEGDMTKRLPDISKMRSILKREFVSLNDGITKVINSIKYE